MKMRHLAGVVLAVALSGCGILIPIPVSMHLYPLQGPIAESNHGTVISADVVTDIFFSSVSVKLPDGETFEGPIPRVSASEPGTDDLASAWDYVYGPGYYVAAVLGAPSRNKAALKGSRSSTLFIDVIQVAPHAPGQGVAKDTNGNIFKVTA